MKPYKTAVKRSLGRLSSEMHNHVCDKETSWIRVWIYKTKVYSWDFDLAKQQALNGQVGSLLIIPKEPSIVLLFRRSRWPWTQKYRTIHWNLLRAMKHSNVNRFVLWVSEWKSKSGNSFSFPINISHLCCMFWLNVIILISLINRSCGVMNDVSEVTTNKQKMTK